LPVTFDNNLMDSAVSEDYQTLQLPALDTRSLEGKMIPGAVSEKKSSRKKNKNNHNSGSKSVEPRGIMTTIPLESIGNESTA